MAISPVNLSRISQNMRLMLSLDATTRNQRDLYRNELRIASGRSFITPSENPTDAALARAMRNELDRQRQLTRNYESATSMLTAADGAVQNMTDLVIEAQRIASMNVSNLTSPAERQSEAEVIASILHELVNIGNRTYAGRYLFAGSDTSTAPFVQQGGGIAYLGNDEPLMMSTGHGRLEPISVPGSELFGALSPTIAGNVDLSPRVTADTRLDDLNGATGHGVRRGVLTVRHIGGAPPFTVDLTSADMVGDIVERFNAAAAAAGSTATAAVTDTGIEIRPGAAPLVLGSGTTDPLVSDLGFRSGVELTSTTVGSNLGARITPLTRVADLRRGAGVDLSGGIRITNGSTTATVPLAPAATVQDVLNAINGAGAFVMARISADGRRLDVFSRVSGVDLHIGEGSDQGATAAALGLRSMGRETPLSSLNYARGVEINSDPDGYDLSIRSEDGDIQLMVKLDGAVTIGDVIDRINEVAEEQGISLEASIADDDNSIALTSGLGGLIVDNAPGSWAADDLGLRGVTFGADGTITGRNVHPVSPPGILDALIRLQNALRQNDDRAITLAAQRAQQVIEDATRIRGMIGARSQGVQMRLSQMQDAAVSMETFLSRIEDLDMASAITELQATQTTLQAGLMTSSKLMNISLMDYLR